MKSEKKKVTGNSLKKNFPEKYQGLVWMHCTIVPKRQNLFWHIRGSNSMYSGPIGLMNIKEADNLRMIFDELGRRILST